MANLANQRGVRTIIAFFGPEAAAQVVQECGRAHIVTATNVFAHIEDVHEIVDSVLAMIGDDGVFITESHYLLALIETLQYDTIYHEHLRHYSLESLGYLLGMHGLEVDSREADPDPRRVDPRVCGAAWHEAGAAERRATARRRARGWSVGRSAQGVQGARGAVEAAAARAC